MRISRYISENKIWTTGNKQTLRCGRSLKRFATSDSHWRTCMGLFPAFSTTVKSQINIQFKKELVSAANQHKFCFTSYPIYSLRRAPAIVCLLALFCIFLTLLQLPFAHFLTILDKAVAVCSHTTQHTCNTVVSVGVPELFIIVIISAHCTVTAGCQLLFFTCIDSMPKERHLLMLFNKMTIIILPYIYINPFHLRVLKYFMKILFLGYNATDCSTCHWKNSSF